MQKCTENPFETSGYLTVGTDRETAWLSTSNHTPKAEGNPSSRSMDTYFQPENAD